MDAQRPGERELARGGPGAVPDPTRLAALRRMVPMLTHWSYHVPVVPCRTMSCHVQAARAMLPGWSSTCWVISVMGRIWALPAEPGC